MELPDGGGRVVEVVVESRPDDDGWPSLLAMVMLVASLVIVFIAVDLYKVKNGLSWKPCMEKKDEDTEDIDNVSLG